MSDVPFSATADATGAAQIVISPGTRQRTWIVSQVAIEVVGAAPVGATATLRKNGNLVSPMIAQADTAGGDPPVTIRGYDQLTVTWAGLTPGMTVRGFAIYDEERET